MWLRVLPVLPVLFVFFALALGFFFVDLVLLFGDDFIFEAGLIIHNFRLSMAYNNKK